MPDNQPPPSPNKRRVDFDPVEITGHRLHPGYKYEPPKPKFDSPRVARPLPPWNYPSAPKIVRGGTFSSPKPIQPPSPPQLAPSYIPKPAPPSQPALPHKPSLPTTPMPVSQPHNRSTSISPPSARQSIDPQVTPFNPGGEQKNKGEKATPFNPGGVPHQRPNWLDILIETLKKIDLSKPREERKREVAAAFERAGMSKHDAEERAEQYLQDAGEFGRTIANWLLGWSRSLRGTGVKPHSTSKTPPSSRSDTRPGAPVLKGDEYHPDKVKERKRMFENVYGKLGVKAFDGEIARDLGYGKKIPPQKARDILKDKDSHGQPVYTNGINYISRDIGTTGESHKGGYWKLFDRRGERIGTYSQDLKTKIGD